MRIKNWQALAVSALSLVLLCRHDSARPVGNAIEHVAERVAGFNDTESAAIGQAVQLMQRGDYSLALVRLGVENKNPSTPAHVRIFTAYALLLAGDSLGAFPREDSRS